MIDIHTHILPLTDDGAENMETSIKMARNALKIGYKKIVASPHYLSDSYKKTKKENKLTLNKLNQKLKENQIDIEILLGNEVYFDMDILNFLNDKKITTINDSNYILIETSLFESPLGFDTLIFKLQSKGYKVIIAHPERNNAWLNKINYLKKLKDNFVYFQMNLGSINGKYGSKIKEFSKLLLEEDLIDLVASDSHSEKNYEYIVPGALKSLEQLVGKDAFDSLVHVNPLNVINNKELCTIKSEIIKPEKISFAKKIMKELSR